MRKLLVGLSVIVFLLSLVSVVFAQTSIPTTVSGKIDSKAFKGLGVPGPDYKPSNFEQGETIILPQDTTIDLVVLRDNQGVIQLTSKYFNGGLICPARTEVRLSKNFWASGDATNGATWGLTDLGVVIVFKDDSFKRGNTLAERQTLDQTRFKVCIRVRSFSRDSFGMEQFIREWILAGGLDEEGSTPSQDWDIVPDPQNADAVFYFDIRRIELSSGRNVNLGAVLLNETRKATTDPYLRRRGVDPRSDISHLNEFGRDETFSVLVSATLKSKDGRVRAKFSSSTEFVFGLYRPTFGITGIEQKDISATNKISDLEGFSSSYYKGERNLGQKYRRLAEQRAIININPENGIK